MSDETASHGTPDDVVPTASSDDSAIEAFEQAQLTERELLGKARSEAVAERNKAATWLLAVGLPPAALVAIALALLIEGSRNLALGFVALGGATLVLKVFRAHRKIREIDKQLEDPMDGS